MIESRYSARPLLAASEETAFVSWFLKPSVSNMVESLLPSQDHYNALYSLCYENRTIVGLQHPAVASKAATGKALVLESLPMNIPLVPLSVSLSWQSKDKGEPKAIAPPMSQTLLGIDREFLLMLAIVIVLSGAFVMVSGMALAHAARR